MSHPHVGRLEREKEASASMTSCHWPHEESLGSTICAEGCLSLPSVTSSQARPLTGVDERCAPRATWSCIDERTHRQAALALRVYPPLSRVGPGGIACSALLA